MDMTFAQLFLRTTEFWTCTQIKDEAHFRSLEWCEDGDLRPEDIFQVKIANICSLQLVKYEDFQDFLQLISSSVWGFSIVGGTTF